MSDHEIRWLFDKPHVSMEVVCNAPAESGCHLQPADEDCQCEEIGRLDSDAEGPFHLVYDSETNDHTIKHRLGYGDHCNVVLFLEDTEEPMEDGPAEPFVIAQTPAEFDWLGDYYTWRPDAANPDATPTTYTGTLNYHGLDLMLDVHDDGHVEVRTRPVLRDAWTLWSAPVTLTPEPSEARA